MNTTTLVRGLVTGCTIAALATLAACGTADGSSAPKDASAADFCAALKDADMSDASSFSHDLAEVGTPAGIPGPARDGFEVMVEKADQDKISSTEEKKVAAFVSYYTEKCSG
ncbi:hypothetical protein ABIE44_001468 [Marmoricola sp. OAE513]|uniref:hypothetical protein n=1 Tax=Marmoricola sp. OAE513 TaxID=2817894 RepID=UPI001AE9F20B